jgi:hypothetical protein
MDAFKRRASLLKTLITCGLGGALWAPISWIFSFGVLSCPTLAFLWQDVSHDRRAIGLAPMNSGQPPSPLTFWLGLRRCGESRIYGNDFGQPPKTWIRDCGRIIRNLHEFGAVRCCWYFHFRYPVVGAVLVFNRGRLPESNFLFVAMVVMSVALCSAIIRGLFFLALRLWPKPATQD